MFWEGRRGDETKYALGGMCSLGRRTPTAGLASEWEREIAGGGGESNAGLTPAGSRCLRNCSECRGPG